MAAKHFTRLTLSIGDDSVSWETTHNDCSALEIVEALKGLMQTHTYQELSILTAMKHILEDNDFNNHTE